MPGVDITATFGKKEQSRNGLNDIAEDLGDKPLDRRLVVGMIEVVRTVIDRTAGDSETQAIRFVHIEAAITDAEENALRKVLTARYKQRTGQPIPEPAAPAPTLFDNTGSDPDDEPDDPDDER